MKHLALLMTVIMLGMVASPLVSSVMADHDTDSLPDEVEAALCGAAAEPLGCTDTDGDATPEDLDLDAFVAGIGVPGATTTVNDAWNTTQRDVIDVGFETLAGSLAGTGLEMAPARDANNTTLDQDDDGSPDAWNVTTPAATITIPSDLIAGWFSNQTPIMPAPHVEPNEGGEDPGVPDADAGAVVVEDGPDGTTLIKINNGDNTVATITIDPNADPLRPRFVTLDLHGLLPPVPVVGFPIYWAPYDFNYLVLSDPADIDGDGFPFIAEHLSGPENGNLFSNPWNRRSISGDADADGCPYDQEPRGGDQRAAINPCAIIFDLDVLGIGAELGDPDLKIWNTVDAVFQVVNNVTTPQENITSWQLWWADRDSNLATRNTICDSNTNGDIVPVDGAATVTCVWDTNDTVDTHDYVCCTPAFRTESYFAFLEVCYEDEEIGCQKTESGSPFVLQNKPRIEYKIVADTIDGDEDDDDDGKLSDVVTFELNATHPAFEVVSLELTTQSCAWRTFAGSSLPLVARRECTPWTTDGFYELETGTPGAGEQVHPDVTKTGPNTFNITIDTSPMEQQRFPEIKRFPFGNVAQTKGLAEGWNFQGVGFRINATTEDGDYRLGVRADQEGFPANVGEQRVLNNRPPEIRDHDLSIDTGSSVDDTVDVLFTFEYYDPEGDLPEELEVLIAGATLNDEDCTRETNAPNELLDGQYPDVPATYVCGPFDASGLDEGLYDWHVRAVDPLRGDNTVVSLSPKPLNLTNAPPILSEASAEPATSTDGLVAGTVQPFTFRVHYEDTSDAAASVQLTLVNDDDPEAEPQIFDMEVCTIPDAGTIASLDVLDRFEALSGGLIGDNTDADFCVDVGINRSASWSYSFSAVDTRGAAVSDVLPGEIDAGDIFCTYCFTESPAVDAGRSVFDAAFDQLGGQSLDAPASGYDFWGALAAPNQPEDDGDFIPGLVEAALLDVDIFTIDEESREMTFEDEWTIAVRQPSGGGTSSHDILRVTITDGSNQGFYAVQVCEGPDGCILYDEELSALDLQVLPQGFEVIGYDADGRRLMSLVVDASNAGSTSAPMAHLVLDFIHDTAPNTYRDVRVMTNPFEVVIRDGPSADAPTTTTDSVLGLAGEDHPTAGFDRNQNGGLIAYVDPDGEAGPSERIEAGLGGNVGAGDGDGDGFPDASEVVICHSVSGFLGGRCHDHDGDGLFEDYEP